VHHVIISIDHGRRKRLTAEVRVVADNMSHKEAVDFISKLTALADGDCSYELFCYHTPEERDRLLRLSGVE